MHQIPGSGAACASRLVWYSPAHNATATNMFQAMATSHWEEVAHCPLWVKSGHGRPRGVFFLVQKADLAARPLNYLVLPTPRAAPATAAEPPAIGLDGAVIHIEVSAWCRAERGRGPPYGYGKAIGVFSKVANANTGVVAGIPLFKIPQSPQ